MYKLSLDFAAADLKTMVLSVTLTSLHDDNNSSVNASLRYIPLYIYIYIVLHVVRNYRTETLTVNAVQYLPICIILYIYIMYILSCSDHIILSSIINNMRKTVAAQLFSRLACNDSSFIFERGELNVL